MSMSAPSFHRMVVEDVIRNLREEFANEGQEERVLDELKALWEAKLVACEAYDPYPSAVGTVAASPYGYDASLNYYVDNTSVAAPAPNLLPLTPSVYNTNPYTAQQASRPQLTAAAASTSAAHVAAMNALRSLNTQITTPVTTANTTTSSALPHHHHHLQQPHLTSQLPQISYGFDTSGKPQQYMPPPGSATGWAQPTTAHNYNLSTIASSSINNNNNNNHGNIRQHDGASDEVDPSGLDRQQIDAILLNRFSAARAQKPAGAQRKRQSKVMSAPSASSSSAGGNLPQLDGLGDGDDDDDDDEDNYERDSAAAAAGDEELGSDLDDEDEAEEPETEHRVLCQYEKVTRVKAKRKAALKDGIMHINGRDYVFSKATGEFDW